jgi:cytochrome c oxidase cbb3-type subunit 1
MVLFGAFYYMLPYLTGRDWPWPRLLKLHFWLVVGGFSVYFFAVSIGGWLQGVGLLEPGRSFEAVTRATMPYLEARSLGGTLMTLGHLVFAFHIAALLMGKGTQRTAIAGQTPETATAGA